MSDTIEQFGDSRVFGQTAIARNAIDGFLIKKVGIKNSPEFFATGTDGGGMVGSVVKPLPSLDMIALKLEGDIMDESDFDTLADYFTATIAGVSRFFIIDKDGKDKKYDEKEFATATVSATSWINVTGPAA